MTSTGFGSVGGTAYTGTNPNVSSESRLAAGLVNLDAQANMLGALVSRLERIAGRIAGHDPKPPQPNETKGPVPVDSHLSKFHRIHAEIGESLKAFERELCKLEENVG